MKISWEGCFITPTGLKDLQFSKKLAGSCSEIFLAHLGKELTREGWKIAVSLRAAQYRAARKACCPVRVMHSAGHTREVFGIKLLPVDPVIQSPAPEALVTDRQRIPSLSPP